MTVVIGTVAPNVWDASVDDLIDNEENVAPSKKHTHCQTRKLKSNPLYDQNGQDRYPVFDQNGWKTLTFRAAHTFRAHIRE